MWGTVMDTLILCERSGEEWLPPAILYLNLLLKESINTIMRSQRWSKWAVILDFPLYPLAKYEGGALWHSHFTKQRYWSCKRSNNLPSSRKLQWSGWLGIQAQICLNVKLILHSLRYIWKKVHQIPDRSYI